MRIAIQYVNDLKGNIQAVQLPVSEWKKVVNRLKKYEQALQLKSDLQEAYAQVTILRKTKGSKRTLNDFLNEL